MPRNCLLMSKDRPLPMTVLMSNQIFQLFIINFPICKSNFFINRMQSYRIQSLLVIKWIVWKYLFRHNKREEKLTQRFWNDKSNYWESKKKFYSAKYLLRFSHVHRDDRVTSNGHYCLAGVHWWEFRFVFGRKRV